MCLKVFFLREVTQFYDIWNSFFAVIKMWRNFCVNIFVPILRLMHSVFLLLLFMILDFGPGVTFMIKYLWQRYFIPWWSCIPGTWFNIFFFVPSFLVPIRYRYLYDLVPYLVIGTGPCKKKPDIPYLATPDIPYPATPDIQYSAFRSAILYRCCRFMVLSSL